MITIYTLEDVHDFLLQKGYPVWSYQVYDWKTGKIRKATIEDFDYSGMHSSTDLVFYDKHGNDLNLTVSVDTFGFITYRDEGNVMGSGSTTYVDKDFTNDWIGFLSQTYGKEYAKLLLQYAINNKQRIKQEAEEKIEKFRLKVHAKAKGSYNYYMDLEQRAKGVLSLNQIAKIGE